MDESTEFTLKDAIEIYNLFQTLPKKISFALCIQKFRILAEPRPTFMIESFSELLKDEGERKSLHISVRVLKENEKFAKYGRTLITIQP